MEVDCLRSAIEGRLRKAFLVELSFLLRSMPPDGTGSRIREPPSLLGRLRSGRPSQTRPFSRHVRQLISPLHCETVSPHASIDGGHEHTLIFFRRHVIQAARTLPERFSLWPGSEMKRYVRSFGRVVGEFGSDMLPAVSACVRLTESCSRLSMARVRVRGFCPMCLSIIHG